MTAKFKVKLAHTDAKMPQKATEQSVGYDCFAVDRTITDKYVEYDLGIIVIPEDENYYVEVFPRSSVTKKHLMLKNSIGVIDPDYRDTIKVRFATAESLGVISEIREFEETPEGFQDTGNTLYITIPLDEGETIRELYEPNERVCQLIVRQKINAEFERVDYVDETDRKGGFGSTGNLEI